MDVDVVECSEDIDDGGSVVSENGIGTSKGGTCQLPDVSGMGIEYVSCCVSSIMTFSIRVNLNNGTILTMKSWLHDGKRKVVGCMAYACCTTFKDIHIDHCCSIVA